MIVKLNPPFFGLVEVGCACQCLQQISLEKIRKLVVKSMKGMHYG